MFSEEWTVEEDEFASHAKHHEDSQEGHVFEAFSDQVSPTKTIEDSQDEYVYEAASDHIIPTKIVDQVMFVDDSEIKLINVAMSCDVSDSLFEQQTIDSNIEVAIVVEIEEEIVDLES